MFCYKISYKNKIIDIKEFVKQNYLINELN